MTRTKSQKQRAAAAAGSRAAKREKPRSKSKPNPPSSSRAKNMGAPLKVVSGLNRSFAAPLNARRFFTESWEERGTLNGIARYSGREMIQLLSGAFTGSPKVFANWLISPNMLSGSRLDMVGSTYDRYRFTRIKIMYSPGCASSTPGQYMFSYDADCTDPTPPSDFSGLRSLAAHKTNMSAAPWEYAEMTWRASTPDWYYSGALNGPALGGVDERLTYQGQLYIASVFDTAAAGGTVWWEYDIEFRDPQIGATNLQTVVYAGGGYSPTAADKAWPAPESATVEGDTNRVVYARIPMLNNNPGFSLPQGVYELVQRGLTGSTLSTTWEAPQFYDHTGKFKPITAKNTFKDTSGSFVGAPYSSRHIIDIPALGGYLLSQATVAAVNAATISLTRLAKSYHASV